MLLKACETALTPLSPITMLKIAAHKQCFLTTEKHIVMAQLVQLPGDGPVEANDSSTEGLFAELGLLLLAIPSLEEAIGCGHIPAGLKNCCNHERRRSLCRILQLPQLARQVPTYWQAQHRLLCSGQMQA